MPDEPPVEVLTELGRVTWVAIKLEDYVEDICSRIESVHPLTQDYRMISQKIKNAKKILNDKGPSATRDRALKWLESAHLAIERRNATLHAIPLAFLNRDGQHELGLGQRPRRDRAYAEYRLTVESLSELRSVLNKAADGWRDLALALTNVTAEPETLSR
jgi:hypothetical protein